MDQLKDILISIIMPALGSVLLVALCAAVREWARGLANERVRRIVEAVVAAVEQQYGRPSPEPLPGATKFDIAAATLEDAGLRNVKRTAIEAAVYKLNQEVCDDESYQ